jgi:hypothetical protein
VQGICFADSESRKGHTVGGVLAAARVMIIMYVYMYFIISISFSESLEFLLSRMASLLEVLLMTAPATICPSIAEHNWT